MVNCPMTDRIDAIDSNLVGGGVLANFSHAGVYPNDNATRVINPKSMYKN